MDKASLMHAVEEGKAQLSQSVPVLERASEGSPPRVLIVDTMAVLHGMKP